MEGLLYHQKIKCNICLYEKPEQTEYMKDVEKIQMFIRSYEI